MATGPPIYSYVLKHFTQHTFVYDSNFSIKDKSECCGAIIENRSYEPIYVLEGEKKIHWRICLEFFECTCIVKYAFKVTSHDSP